jgi:hypothetical protein
LWDAATKLKSLEKSKKNGLGTEKECLRIRKHAIILLLPYTSVEKVDALLKKTNFESACTYAWKAASVFAQHAAEDQLSTLEGFYADMTHAMNQSLAVNPLVPMGYVEFIAYKSLHLPPSITQLSELNIEFGDGADIGTGDYGSVLNFIKLIVHCKSRIDFLAAGEAKGNKFGGNSSLEKSILKMFNRHFQNNTNDVRPEVANKIFKLLCCLSLQKTLFDALKTSATTLITMEKELLLGAELLVCIGAVGMYILEVSSEKAPLILDMVCECFIRPLSIYEKLNDEFQNEGRQVSSLKYMSLADDICEQYYATLERLSQTKGGLSSASVEKGAKVKNFENIC